MSLTFPLFSQVSSFSNFWSRNASQTAFVSRAGLENYEVTQNNDGFSRAVSKFRIQYRKKLLLLVAPVTRLVEIVKTHVVHSVVFVFFRMKF